MKRAEAAAENAASPPRAARQRATMAVAGQKDIIEQHNQDATLFVGNLDDRVRASRPASSKSTRLPRTS